jgi:hypothetical protein
MSDIYQAKTADMPANTRHALMKFMPLPGHELTHVTFSSTAESYITDLSTWEHGETLSGRRESWWEE